MKKGTYLQGVHAGVYHLQRLHHRAQLLRNLQQTLHEDRDDRQKANQTTGAVMAGPYLVFPLLILPLVNIHRS